MLLEFSGRGKDAAKHLAMHMAAPIKVNYIIPNLNTAEVEKILA